MRASDVRARLAAARVRPIRALALVAFWSMAAAPSGASAAEAVVSGCEQVLQPSAGGAPSAELLLGCREELALREERLATKEGELREAPPPGSFAAVAGQLALLGQEEASIRKRLDAWQQTLGKRLERCETIVRTWVVARQQATATSSRTSVAGAPHRVASSRRAGQQKQAGEQKDVRQQRAAPTARVYPGSRNPTQPGASAGAGGPIVLVVDISNSMSEPFGAGTKFGIMSEAARQLVDALDARATVGLTVFGTGMNCTAVEVPVPPASGKLAEVRRVTRGLRVNPAGNTPLTAALETAIRAAGRGHEITVLLLSDGGEACGRDPVRMLEELRQAGYRFRIHALTFEQIYEPRLIMAAIASIGGGRLVQFRPGDEVGRRLRRLLDELAR